LWSKGPGSPLVAWRSGNRRQSSPVVPQSFSILLTIEKFDAWFAKLKGKQAIRRIQVRIDRAEDENFGDCEPVGEGVSEMRIHYGPGYRVYFTQRGMEIVILLAGGDKSTQAKEIKSRE
jgi:putative addiction module killer protein